MHGGCGGGGARERERERGLKKSVESIFDELSVCHVCDAILNRRHVSVQRHDDSARWRHQVRRAASAACDDDDDDELLIKSRIEKTTNTSVYPPEDVPRSLVVLRCHVS